MIYLQKFHLLTREEEEEFLSDPSQRRTCYPSKYPFHVFRYRQLPDLEFAPITILYGGNGSGKSTILNIMAEKLGLKRGAVYNRSPFFENYVNRCRFRLAPGCPEEAIGNGRVITSDDVFDYLLNIRYLHENLDDQREKLLAEYRDIKYASFQMRSMEDYEQLKKKVDATRKSGSQYARSNLMEAPPERSNGESALSYFTQTVQENALYLLDEPENSLSAARQLELQQFLQDSARFFGCQFVISTHSPFLLAIPGAKVYDLDAQPPQVRRWTELETVRIYREFFKNQEMEFTAL